MWCRLSSLLLKECRLESLHHNYHARAQVESLDALKTFRAALFKFAESIGVAIGDAESEMHARSTWLEVEQNTYWQSQIRKRQEALANAGCAAAEDDLQGRDRPSAVGG